MFNLEKKSMQLTKTYNDLAAEKQEMRSAHLRLEKLASDFRQAHCERAALMQQWNDTLQAIGTRDAAVQVSF